MLEIGFLLKKGKYKIKVLDLNMLLNSDMFNVFEYMYFELDVDWVLEVVIEVIKEGEKMIGEDFWIKVEGLLVCFFIVYLWFDGCRNDYMLYLGMIVDMLCYLKWKDKNVFSLVEEWFEELNEVIFDNYVYW